MKKIILSLVLFMFLPIYVNAVDYDFVQDVCKEQKGCLLMCKYEAEASDGNKYNVMVLYRHKEYLAPTGTKLLSDKEKFIVIHGTESFNKFLKSGLFDGDEELFALPKKSSDYATDDAMAALNQGRCPAYVAYDNDYDNEACLTDTANKCDSKNNSGTDYTSSTSETLYNFMDEIKDYIYTFKDKTYTCDDLMENSSDVDTYVNDITKAGVLKLFKENEYSTNEIIPLYKNSSVYKAYLAEVGNKIIDQTGECVKEEEEELEEKLENGEITQDEYDDKKDDLDEKKDDLKNQAKEFNSTIEPLAPNISVNINVDASGCGLISNDFREFLQWILDLIRVAGLVLTVVMGILDYAKATFANKEDAMKEANKNFSTRILCLGLLLLVPTLINLILSIFDVGIYEGTENITCGLK